MLYRKIERTIEQHLKSASNKILLVDGARQIGKTYIELTHSYECGLFFNKA